METFTVRTPEREVLVDITDEVAEIVSSCGVEKGICIVFVPHTTAGVTINENADPSVKTDITAYLRKLIPQNGGFRHMEGNSDAHIKASLMGFSQTILVDDHRLVLGTWQGICLAEFDGSRTRKVHVRVMGN